MLILVTIPIFWSRLIGYGIAVVLRSEHDGVKNGDYMYGLFRAYTSNYLHDIHLVDCTEHQQYNICTDLKTTQVINNQYNLPLSAFIGPAGMPGRCFIGIRIFSLSIRHRTSCIYGLEEILTCKGGGSLFVWLIADYHRTGRDSFCDNWRRYLFFFQTFSSELIVTFGPKVPWDRKRTQDVSILISYLALCSIVI